MTPDPTTLDDAANGVLEAALGELLVATEALYEALSLDRVATEAEPDELLAAYHERERSFERLRTTPRPAGWRPSAVARACLERIRELDGEMLALGEASATALRGERHGLQRRRQAIHSQLSGEREQPRLITVKA